MNEKSNSGFCFSPKSLRECCLERLKQRSAFDNVVTNFVVNIKTIRHLLSDKEIVFAALVLSRFSEDELADETLKRLRTKVRCTVLYIICLHVRFSCNKKLVFLCFVVT